MNGQGTNADFAVEVRERYGEVVRDQWPVSVDPLPDELLSSWVHRLAFANGIAPRSFAGVLGSRDGMWTPRLDVRLPRDVAVLLASQTGIAHEAISAMTLTDDACTPLLLPLRENARRNRSTWMQYCPLCLANDDAPYFRKEWRLASRISCFVHGCGLRDRCPACRSGIASFDLGELVPQHFCVRCGFDLRNAVKASVKASAQRLERAIADMWRVESAKGSPATRDLIPRLLRAPVAAGDTGAKSLTSLSTSARIRCFERLASEPHDRLISGTDAGAAYRRFMILAAGSHDKLIARFADFLDRHQGQPRPKHSPPAGADRSALFEAYLRVMQAGDARPSAESGRVPTPAGH
ncbi:TniQ family protein [Rhizobiales bacterium 3FA27D7]|uniref:TniQ family protein n=1 Tax=Mesorhizobium sp. 2RAF21 TaxID=3232995 RepID=UPI0010F9817C